MKCVSNHLDITDVLSQLQDANELYHAIQLRSISLYMYYCFGKQTQCKYHCTWLYEML